MTTQAELLQLAEKHKDNPAVRILLTSLTQAQDQAIQRLKATISMAGTLEKGVQLHPGYAVSNDPSSFVATAAQASAAIAGMSADLMSLACLLENLGEQISY